MRPWTEAAWLDEARGWIAERLAEVDTTQIGGVEQPHVRPWSTALRILTSEGVLWFKANARVLTHEAAAVRHLAAARPALVPELVALDLDRGWMLMRDAGERLREVVARERDLDRWLVVLPLYGELQLAAARRADELVAAGVPDYRCAQLPEMVSRITVEARGLDGEARRLLSDTGTVTALCEKLAAVGVPESIQHNDLHDGQVFVRGGRYRILDWGDACVSHPFLTMSVTLEGQLAWGLDDVEGSLDTTRFRDAYLEPFAPFAARQDLVVALEAALRLGWIARALVTLPLALELGSPHDQPLHDHIRMYVQRFLDSAAAG